MLLDLETHGCCDGEVPQFFIGIKFAKLLTREIALIHAWAN